MEKVVFTAEWKDILAENGFETFEDLYYNIPKKRINSNNKRNVSLIRLKVGGEENNFYLKRFCRSHFKDMIFAFLNTGQFYSQAAFEWSNIELLKKNNIGAPNCICYGEDKWLGVERKSFIITEELQSQCLTIFLAENWGRMSEKEKHDLIVAIARAVKKIHKAWISLPDLYIWHIFVSKKGDDYNFSFIDFNRMKRHVTNPQEKIEDLGRLHYSMIDKYFDKDMKKLLVEAYAENEEPEKIEKLLRRVKKYSKKFSIRREIKPNY